MRVLIGPFTNLWQKQLVASGIHPLAVTALLYCGLGLVLLPLAMLQDYSSLDRSFWITVTAASLIDALGNLLMIHSLRSTPLSVFGPLNAFKPGIALLLAWPLLGQVPGAPGVTGMLIIAAGSLLLTWTPGEPWRFTTGLGYRLAGIFCSALGAVICRQALESAPAAVVLTGWVYPSLLVLLLSLLALRNTRPAPAVLQPQAGRLLALVLGYGMMQYLTLLCFRLTLVGYALALFQLSGLISLFLGHRVLGEQDLLRKTLAAIIMAGGAALIVLQGKA